MENPKTEKVGKIEGIIVRAKNLLIRRNIKNLENDLKKHVEFLARNGRIDNQFFTFVRDNFEADQQIQFWKIVFTRKNLTPADLYEISEAISDETLRTEAQKKYVVIAPEDGLVTVIRYKDNSFQEMAWQELCRRFQIGIVKKRRTKEILIKLFEDIPNYRKKFLDILKWLDPTDNELRSLLNLPGMDKEPVLSNEIQKMIRCKKKKSDNTELISKIVKIQNKLKQLK